MTVYSGVIMQSNYATYLSDSYLGHILLLEKMGKRKEQSRIGCFVQTIRQIGAKHYTYILYGIKLINKPLRFWVILISCWS